jgi:predicted O-linked N-acetylglucosamine transferase (SPINDLY family)
MKLISSVDICLDPFPHSGGATTAHSLWMGVPVISLKGETEFQNISSAILSDVGLEDLICESEEDYVYCVVNFGKDRLSKLRSDLRSRFPKSPKDSVSNLEKLYERLVG